MAGKEKQPGEMIVTPIKDGYQVEIEGGLEAIEVPEEIINELREKAEVAEDPVRQFLEEVIEEASKKD